MKINSFTDIHPKLFKVLLLFLVLGGTGHAQILQPGTGAITFKTAPCSLLCNPQYWNTTNEGQILETIAAARNPDALDATDRTALFYAAIYGDVSHVAALLAKGVDPNGNAKENGFVSPLAEHLRRAVFSSRIAYTPAIIEKHGPAPTLSIDIVRLLINAGAELDLPGDQEYPAFLMMLETGDPALLELLRDHVSYPDLLQKYEFEALKMAFRLLNEPLIDLLVSDGASLSTTEPESGKPLLHTLLPSFHTHASEKMMSVEYSMVPSDHIAPLQLLLDRGVDPDIRDENGRTPLMNAISAAHWGVVEWLLDQGVDPNLVDQDGNNALFYIIPTHEMFYLFSDVTASAPIFARLIDAGADPLHRNNDGLSLLHIAALAPARFPIDLVLPSFPDIETRDNQGRTPFFVSITEGQSKVIRPIIRGNAPVETVLQAFLDHGADINAPDNQGATALYRLIAAETFDRSLSTVRFLVENGAVSLAPGGITCNVGHIPRNDYLRTRLGDQMTYEHVLVKQTCHTATPN